MYFYKKHLTNKIYLYKFKHSCFSFQDASELMYKRLSSIHHVPNSFVEKVRNGFAFEHEPRSYYLLICFVFPLQAS